MYTTIQNALELDDSTMVFVTISMSTAVFQLFVLLFYFKKPVEWIMIFYLIIIFVYNVTYYSTFTVSMPSLSIR